jgi:uncharacterized protein (TIGR02452 family)
MGGGAKTGAMAQEEELFRRSNYFLADSEPFYPLKRMECVYTPDVMVIKDRNYEELSAPFQVSMLAVAAIKNPVCKDGRFTLADERVTAESIENIFRVALLKGHSRLVLGALGCGAYNNPPQLIARLFNISLQKYSGCFKTVAFAVLSSTDGNFETFNEIISI